MTGKAGHFLGDDLCIPIHRYVQIAVGTAAKNTPGFITQASLETMKENQMIFKVYKDGKDTGVYIANKNDETAIRDLDRHISKLGTDEWEDDYQSIISEIKSTLTGMVIVELRMEHFDMNESDEVQEIHIWELMKDG